MEVIIDRKNIYYGKVALVKGIEVVKNKERSALYTVQSSEFTKFKVHFYDIFNETPKYFNVEKLDYFSLNNLFVDFYKSKDYGNIFVYNGLNLNTLLEYFGFPKKMTAQDCMDMYKNLFDGKFAYENCALFGYQKKPAFIWKNGIQVAREQKLDKYSMSSYDLVNENELTPYFEALNQIDYHNPKACFEPFEEEGQIRKRTL